MGRKDQAPKAKHRAMLPNLASLTGRDSRRVVVTPPRPRAKWCGFYAPLRPPPSRATAGLAGGKSVHENHANSCGFMQFR